MLFVLAFIHSLIGIGKMVGLKRSSSWDSLLNSGGFLDSDDWQDVIFNASRCSMTPSASKTQWSPNQSSDARRNSRNIVMKKAFSCDALLDLGHEYDDWINAITTSTRHISTPPIQKTKWRSSSVKNNELLTELNESSVNTPDLLFIQISKETHNEKQLKTSIKSILPSSKNLMFIPDPFMANKLRNDVNQTTTKIFGYFDQNLLNAHHLISDEFGKSELMNNFLSTKLIHLDSRLFHYAINGMITLASTSKFKEFDGFNEYCYLIYSVYKYGNAPNNKISFSNYNIITHDLVYSLKKVQLNKKRFIEFEHLFWNEFRKKCFEYIIDIYPKNVVSNLKTIIGQANDFFMVVEDWIEVCMHANGLSGLIDSENLLWKLETLNELLGTLKIVRKVHELVVLQHEKIENIIVYGSATEIKVRQQILMQLLYQPEYSQNL